MIQTVDYIDVEKRMKELGFSVENNLVLLPANFMDPKAETLVRSRNEDSVRKIWREAGLSVQTLSKQGVERPARVPESLEWIAPVIYVVANYVKDNPEQVKTAFEALSDYLKRIAKNQKVKVDVVTIQTKDVKYKMISYEGNAEGIKDLANIIREVVDK